MREKYAERPSVRQRVKAKKERILQVALLLFAVCYPLTHLAAGGGGAFFMGAALGLCAIGCLLAAIL